MKIEKIQKLRDQEIVNVKGQDNCSVVGQTTKYEPGQDCLNDCTLHGMPRYYLSEFT